MRPHKPIAMAFLAILASGLAVTAPAQARTARAEIFVLHGIPDVAARVRVDGRPAGRLAAGGIVGPVSVAPGRHTVSLVVPGEAPLTGTVDVDRGRSVDVVAHLPADPGGPPKLTAFANDVSPVGPGKTRLAVAHTAQVPPADVRVDGKPLLRNVANAEVLTLEVPAGSYEVDIVATGTSGPSVFGPVDFAVKPGTLTRVFAFGSPAEGTMDVLVHQLPVRQQGAGQPSMVQTGTGGQLAQLLARRP